MNDKHNEYKCSCCDGWSTKLNEHETKLTAALARVSELEASVIYWRDAWAKAQVEVDTRPFPEDAKMKITNIEAEKDDALALLNKCEIERDTIFAHNKQLEAVLRQNAYMSDHDHRSFCNECDMLKGQKHQTDCHIGAALIASELLEEELDHYITSFYEGKAAYRYVTGRTTDFMPKTSSTCECIYDNDKNLLLCDKHIDEQYVTVTVTNKE